MTRGSPPRRTSRDGTADAPDTAPVDASHPFAKLAALKIAAPRSAVRSVTGSPTWVEEVIEGGHAELRLDANGHIVHVASKRSLAAIVRGASIALPDVRLNDGDGLGAGAQRRLHRRALAFARDVVSELLGGMRELVGPGESSSRSIESSAALRGLVHRLEQGLGTVLARDVADVCAVLDDETRAALARAQLSLGDVVVYISDGLSPTAIAARIALATTWYGAGRALRPPPGGAVSFPAGRGVDRAAYAAVGFPVFSARAVRADVVERIASRVRVGAEAEAGAIDDAEIATWLGCPTREVRKILASVLTATTSSSSSTGTSPAPATSSAKI